MQYVLFQQTGPDVHLNENLTLLVQGSWNKAFTEFLFKTQCSMQIPMQADGYLQICSLNYTDLSWINKTDILTSSLTIF